MGPRELYISSWPEQGWVARLLSHILIPQPLMLLSLDVSPLFAQRERLRLPEQGRREQVGDGEGVLSIGILGVEDHQGKNPQ